jgi:hypothetical protein
VFDSTTLAHVCVLICYNNLSRRSLLH